MVQSAGGLCLSLTERGAFIGSTWWYEQHSRTDGLFGMAIRNVSVAYVWFGLSVDLVALRLFDRLQEMWHSHLQQGEIAALTNKKESHSATEATGLPDRGINSIIFNIKIQYWYCNITYSLDVQWGEIHEDAEGQFNRPGITCHNTHTHCRITLCYIEKWASGMVLATQQPNPELWVSLTQTCSWPPSWARACWRGTGSWSRDFSRCIPPTRSSCRRLR